MSNVHVLLVEDELLLSMGMQQSLEDAGFVVHTVADGAAAVRALEDPQMNFGALLTDIRLPSRLNGWDVARRARELQRYIPVIYTSGDHAEYWRAYGVPDSVMLAKPFAMTRAIKALQYLLSQVPRAAQPRAGLAPG
jgi:DNA-binding response OmpR family regulator